MLNIKGSIVALVTPFNEDGSVKKEYYTDALHPNALGHAAMAEVLCKRLEELFPAT